MQISAIAALPPASANDIWSAFAAHHLVQLTAALHVLSLPAQREAISTLIQILSLLPEPKNQPYFRKFLQNISLSNGLPTLVANAFVQGITWKRPSGPGIISTVIINLLFWCSTSQGDDESSAIDAEVRIALAKKLEDLKGSELYGQLEHLQQVEIRRLMGVLGVINSEEMPGDHYLRHTQQYLTDHLDMCEKSSCAEEAELTCSRCKSVRYCGTACQTWHWKKDHKFRCFQTSY